MKRILCFGDSNAWGYIPGKGDRWPESVRWPAVAETVLGNDYRIIEDNISGRTTIFEDPKLPYRCGLESLGYSLIAHAPIDLLILALGSNDLKFTDAEGSKKGLSQLIDLVFSAEEQLQVKGKLFRGDKRILLIGPPIIAPEMEVMRSEHALAHASTESCFLAKYCESLAEERGLDYLDASAYVYPSDIDCLHLPEEAQQKLGKIIARKIRDICA